MRLPLTIREDFCLPTRPLSAFNAALTWLLAGLMAEPQANLLGQQVSPYERALEVLTPRSEIIFRSRQTIDTPLPARTRLSSTAARALATLGKPLAPAPGGKLFPSGEEAERNPGTGKRSSP